MCESRFTIHRSSFLILCTPPLERSRQPSIFWIEFTFIVLFVIYDHSIPTSIPRLRVAQYVKVFAFRITENFNDRFQQNVQHSELGFPNPISPRFNIYQAGQTHQCFTVSASTFCAYYSVSKHSLSTTVNITPSWQHVKELRPVCLRLQLQQTR